MAKPDQASGPPYNLVMPPPPEHLAAIRDKPDDELRWLALAAWYWDNGREDEAAVVRVYRPTLRDNLAHTSLEQTLADVRRNAWLLGRLAREIEERRDYGRPEG